MKFMSQARLRAGARFAAVFSAAVFSLPLASVSAWAAAGGLVVSITPSSGPPGTVVAVTTNFTSYDATSLGTCAPVANVRFGGNSVVATSSLDGGGNLVLTATAPSGAGTGPVAVDADFRDSVGAGCVGGLFTFATNGVNFTYPAGGGGTNSDSTNLRTLQNGVTKSVATVSAQTVTSQISGAIDGAFGDSGNPVSIGANGVTVNFAATPKSDIEKRTDDAFAALAYAGNATKAPARSLVPYNEWSAWLDIRGTGWQNHNANSGMNGAQFNGTAGLARKLTPDFLVGVYGGYEYFKYNIAAISAEMKGSGGSAGGYFGWRLTSTVRLDASLGYGRVAYSATSGTATGSFNGDRLVASSGLTGSYRVGVFKIEPSARVFALWEKQSAWVDSLGTAQASRTFSAGRTSLGAKLIRQIEYGAVTLAPYAGFYGDYRFSSDNATPGGTPVVGIGDGWSGRATAGISLIRKNGSAIGLSGELGGLGAAYKVWSGNVRASMAF